MPIENENNINNRQNLRANQQDIDIVELDENGNDIEDTRTQSENQINSIDNKIRDK